MSKIVVASVLVVGLLAGVPASASVVYTSRTSSISLTHCGDSGPCTAQDQSATDLDPFSVGFTGGDGTGGAPNSSSVSQQSQISGNTVAVQMSAYKSGLDSGSSSFKLDFTLDANTNFTISGNNGFFLGTTSSSIQLTGPTALGFADVSCTSSGNFNSCTYANNSGFPPPFSTTTLTPGAYELLMAVDADGPDFNGGHSSSANFTLSFAPSPVPIPAAGWLLFSALGGMPWVARRKRLAEGAHPL